MTIHEIFKELEVLQKEADAIGAEYDKYNWPSGSDFKQGRADAGTELYHKITELICKIQDSTNVTL